MNMFFSMRHLIFLTLWLTSYLVFPLLNFHFQPVPLANFLGFMALIFYMMTLAPSILRKVFPKIRSDKMLILLLKNRRNIGIASYVLASNHGLLMVISRDIDLLNSYTYIHYFQGISAFFIMSLLTITSNDVSVKYLKKNWRKIHQLTYLLIFILPWHILDKMSGHWTYLTILSVFICFMCIYLFIKRMILENVVERSR